jgi:hypothetical protein
LVGDDFKYTRDNFRKFANNGLMPNFEGLKEETFLSNMFTIGGAKDILPLNMLGDFSNRSLSQSFNYQQRAVVPSIVQTGKHSIFSSPIGKALGVNYDSLERSQHFGATTNDEDLLKVVQELSNIYPILKNFMGSVREGGILMSSDMAKELTSYKEVLSKGISAKKIRAAFKNRFGVTDKDLEDLEVGDTLEINPDQQLIEGWEGTYKFGKGFSVKAGDLVLGIRRTAQGF